MMIWNRESAADMRGEIVLRLYEAEKRVICDYLPEDVADASAVFHLSELSAFLQECEVCNSEIAEEQRVLTLSVAAAVIDRIKAGGLDDEMRAGLKGVLHGVSAAVRRNTRRALAGLNREVEICKK